MASPARFAPPAKSFETARALIVGALTALAAAGCSSDVTRFDYPAFGLTESNPRSRPAPAPVMRPMQQPAQADEYAYEQPSGEPQAYGTQPRGYGGAYGGNGSTTYRPYSGPAADAGGAPAGTACGANPCESAQAQHSQRRRPSGVLGYAPPPKLTPPKRSAGLNSELPPLPPGAPLADSEPLPLYPDDAEEQQNTEAYPAEESSARMELPPPLPAPQPGMLPSGPDLGGQALAEAPSAYVPPEKPKTLAKGGATILVGEGDSLFRIAQDYGVSVSALMSANKLSTPAVRPGQKLFIPGSKGAKSLRERKPRPDPKAAVAAAVPAPAKAPAPKPAAMAQKPAAKPLADGAPGTYTVRSGESFNMVARRLGVKPAELAAANNITDPTRIRQGQVLRIPGPATAGGLADMEPAALEPAAQKPAAQKPVAEVAAPELSAEAPEMPAASKPKAPTKMASAGKTATDAPAEAVELSEGSGKFRWPVRGRVIGKFDQKAAIPNEGIDLAVPVGTEVHAAEDGTVAYAGDELANYGKIVLVRHSGGWVTAYAHNDQLLVKRGEAVRRGQVIAKAGKTGKVDQPMVHFELRKGDQPVDPLPYLAAK